MVATVPKTAGEIMRTDVFTVRDNWDIREALRLFEEKHISGAPVIDLRGGLVGVVSVTDIARAQTIRDRKERDESEFYRTTLPDRFPSGFQVERYDQIPIADVMTPVVIDAAEELEAARLVEPGAHALPEHRAGTVYVALLVAEPAEPEQRLRSGRIVGPERAREVFVAVGRVVDGVIGGLEEQRVVQPLPVGRMLGERRPERRQEPHDRYPSSPTNR